MTRRYQAADRIRHDWLELHAHALTVPCGWCGQPVDLPCVNGITGEQLAAPAHPPRITDANTVAELADEAEARTGP